MSDFSGRISNSNAFRRFHPSGKKTPPRIHVPPGGIFHRRPGLAEPANQKRIVRAIILGLAAHLLAGVGRAHAEPPPTKVPLPALLICEKNRNALAHVNSHGNPDWDYDADGPLWDVQSEPSGRYLVTGGTQNVFLLRKVWKGCRVLWDWGEMEGVSIRSAVATDWDEAGDPSLVLAADSQNQRVFLAEGKSKGVKIRWEFKLPAPPVLVRVCPDSNNFLVVLQDSTVEEILYQEDKVVWSLGKEDGLQDVRDAVRGPWGKTYVADGPPGLVLCFDPRKKLVWKAHLPFAPSPSFQAVSLSLLKKKGKRMLMVSVHWDAGETANVIYLLNPETGKVIGWNDRPEKGSYPSFGRVVPDLSTYGHR